MTEKIYKFICEKCNYKGNIPAQWEKHINTELHITGKKKERSDKKDPYKCDKCNYETKNKLGLKQHYLNWHSTLEEREKNFNYYCKKCNFGTFSIDLMNTHNNTKKHQYNEKLYL
jgi:hypothetical protein